MEKTELVETINYALTYLEENGIKVAISPMYSEGTRASAIIIEDNEITIRDGRFAINNNNNQ